MSTDEEKLQNLADSLGCNDDAMAAKKKVEAILQDLLPQEKIKDEVAQVAKNRATKATDDRIKAKDKVAKLRGDLANVQAALAEAQDDFEEKQRLDDEATAEWKRLDRDALKFSAKAIYQQFVAVKEANDILIERMGVIALCKRIKSKRP